jgi:hypothetical protein
MIFGEDSQPIGTWCRKKSPTGMAQISLSPIAEEQLVNSYQRVGFKGGLKHIFIGANLAPRVRQSGLLSVGRAVAGVGSRAPR